jgi:hypothetical protein
MALVTVRPPASPDPGGDQAPAEPVSRARWLARMSDRVPTGWFAGILTAVFLGVTAAFGGLTAVAAPPIAQLDAGDTHENAQFALTVERAVLIDELPEAGIFLEEDAGQRVLAVVVTAENVWTEALPSNNTGGTQGVVGSVRIADLGDVPAESIARFDDTTIDPYLQPDVPVQLVLTWAVDAEQFSDADELRLELRDFSLYTGQLITYGTSWQDPVTAASLTLEIDDVGAGADAESGTEGADDWGRGSSGRSGSRCSRRRGASSS